MNTKSFLKASVAALALAFSSTAVMAQSTSADAAATQQDTKCGVNGESGPRGHKQHKPMHGRMNHDKRGFNFKDVGLLVPGFGPVPQAVVDSLELTDAQKDKIAQAKSKIEEKRQKMAENRKEHRPFAEVSELRAKQLEEGKLDPKAILKEREKQREQMKDQHEAFTDEWIAVWNDLNDEQQAKVAAYFKEHASKERAPKMRDIMERGVRKAEEAPLR